MTDPKRKIMLLDDNIISMMVTADVLSSHGYEVVQTTSPNGSIAKLEYERPDVLLVDVDMPRLSFDDVLRNIQVSEELKDLVVVLFSSRTPSELCSVCETKDLHGYFSKTMDVTRLPEYVDYFF